MKRPHVAEVRLRFALVRLLVVAAALGGAIGAGPVGAAGPGQPKGGYGYDDTPLLPGSTWRVHDRRRPLKLDDQGS